ncbi:MAG: M28 family peptidase [Candidatus Bathyarchaeia archaeon]
MMKRLKLAKQFIFLLILIFLLSITMNLLDAYKDFSFSEKNFLSPSLRSPRELLDYAEYVAQNINMTAIKEHIRFLSQLKTRFPGSEGYYRAAEYIKAKFIEYGLENVSYQNFKMASPVFYGSYLEVISASTNNRENITLEPLLPNVVALPAGTYEGELIYAGLGSYEEFEKLNKNVTGSIAILEYASGRNWVNAFSLGCKAVIFIESNSTTTYSNLVKTASVAVNLPRYYISYTDFLKIRKLIFEGPVKARIVSKAAWEKISAMNVIGFVKGANYPDQILLLIAHFDSFSTVPGVAPGANEAQGIAALLELARFYSRSPPARTIMFLAVSGHWQSYYGMREFMEEYFFGASKDIGSKIRMSFYLDFYTFDSDSIVVQATGPVASYSGARYSKYTEYVAKLIFTLGSPSFKSYIDPVTNMKYEYGAESITCVLQDVFGDKKSVVFKVGDQIYGALAPWISAGGTTLGIGASAYIWDGELLMGTGGISLAITSGSTSRALERTPLDTIDKVNFENLNHVLKYAFNVIFFFANADDSIYENIPRFKISRYDPNNEIAFVKLHVQVVEYDKTKTGWYKPVPGALVVLYQGASGYGTYVLGQVPNTQIIEIADENGIATFKGLRSAFIFMGAMFSYNIEGYVVDRETGNLLYAPNQGSFSLAQFVSIYTPNKAEEFVSINVFKAGTIVLFEVFSPLELPGGGWSLSPGQTGVQPLEAQSFSVPFFYGVKSDVILSISAVYVEPDTPVIIEYKFPGKILGVLRNVSMDSPMGVGYKVGLGELLPIYFTSYKVSLDTWILNEERLRVLGRHYVYSAGGKAEYYHGESAKHLRAAEEALRNLKYAKLFGESWKAWSYEVMAYEIIKVTTIDAVNTASFFIALAIPFAFVFERLFFSFDQGWKRLVTILGTIIVLLGLLAIMHPGFALASNIIMFVLGTAIIFLLIPAIFIVFSEIRDQLKKFKEAMVGFHTREISTVSAIMMAFSIGVSHQRKRRFRTLLNQVSVILITFALISMVSISTFSEVIRVPQPLMVKPVYSGLLIRDREWREISQDQFNAISAACSDIGIISPRVWWFPPYIFGQTQSILFWVSYQLLRWNIDVAKALSKEFGLKGKNDTLPVFAVWGLSPQESEVTRLRVVEGKWIEPNDGWVCLLTVDDARAIGVSVGDTVEYYGLTFVVKGLVNASEMYITDIDGEPITPISFEDVFYEVQAKRQVTNYANLHLKPHSYGRFIIVPYQIAIDMGGSIVSVAIKINPEKSELGKIVAAELADKLGVDIYLSLEETIVYRKGIWYFQRGFELIILPLIVGALTIALTLEASIIERTKEIFIFSSLGISPMQIAGIFMTECFVTALIGAVLGYLLGVFNIYIGVMTGSVGQVIMPNYSSRYVIIAVCIAVVSTLCVSAYPLYKVSKLVTPSLERKWKLTKPKDDVWEVPLPFLCKSREEALGTFEYLREYLSQFKSERVGTFMVGDLQISVGSMEGSEVLDLIFDVILAPYEQGVTEKVVIRSRWSHRVKAYTFELSMKRLTGPASVWRISNPRFIDAIRKQLLMWRLLPDERRNSYIERSQILLKKLR